MRREPRVPRVYLPEGQGGGVERRTQGNLELLPHRDEAERRGRAAWAEKGAEGNFPRAEVYPAAPWEKS